MFLIRIDETGIQHQYKFPTLEKEPGLCSSQGSTQATSGKEERIKRMLAASNKKLETTDMEFVNSIEPNYIYASISGYEYIKMNINEFIWFINILNALIEIDTDELGFYGINLFAPKEAFGSSIKSYELVPFELGTYSSTVMGMTDALRAGLFDEENPMSFFDDIRYLG